MHLPFSVFMGLLYGLINAAAEPSSVEGKLALLLLLFLVCNTRKKYLSLELISTVRLCAALLSCQHLN